MRGGSYGSHKGSSGSGLNKKKRIEEDIDHILETYISDDDDKNGKFNQSVCSVCGRGGLLLLCDCCSNSIHPECSNPPILDPNEIPTGEWFCPHCEHYFQSHHHPDEKVPTQQQKQAKNDDVPIAHKRDKLDPQYFHNKVYPQIPTEDFMILKQEYWRNYQERGSSSSSASASTTNLGQNGSCRNIIEEYYSNSEAIEDTRHKEDKEFHERMKKSYTFQIDDSYIWKINKEFALAPIWSAPRIGPSEEFVLEILKRKYWEDFLPNTTKKVFDISILENSEEKQSKFKKIMRKVKKFNEERVNTSSTSNVNANPTKKRGGKSKNQAVPPQRPKISSDLKDVAGDLIFFSKILKNDKSERKIPLPSEENLNRLVEDMINDINFDKDDLSGSETEQNPSNFDFLGLQQKKAPASSSQSTHHHQDFNANTTTTTNIGNNKTAKNPRGAGRKKKNPPPPPTPSATKQSKNEKSKEQQEVEQLLLEEIGEDQEEQEGDQEDDEFDVNDEVPDSKKSSQKNKKKSGKKGNKAKSKPKPKKKNNNFFINNFLDDLDEDEDKDKEGELKEPKEEKPEKPEKTEEKEEKPEEKGEKEEKSEEKREEKNKKIKKTGKKTEASDGDALNEDDEDNFKRFNEPVEDMENFNNFLISDEDDEEKPGNVEKKPNNSENEVQPPKKSLKPAKKKSKSENDEEEKFNEERSHIPFNNDEDDVLSLEEIVDLIENIDEEENVELSASDGGGGVDDDGVDEEDLPFSSSSNFNVSQRKRKRAAATNSVSNSVPGKPKGKKRGRKPKQRPKTDENDENEEKEAKRAVKKRRIVRHHTQTAQTMQKCAKESNSDDQNNNFYAYSLTNRYKKKEEPQLLGRGLLNKKSRKQRQLSTKPKLFELQEGENLEIEEEALEDKEEKEEEEDYLLKIWFLHSPHTLPPYYYEYAKSKFFENHTNFMEIEKGNQERSEFSSTSTAAEGDAVVPVKYRFLNETVFHEMDVSHFGGGTFFEFCVKELNKRHENIKKLQQIRYFDEIEEGWAKFGEAEDSQFLRNNKNLKLLFVADFVQQKKRLLF